MAARKTWRIIDLLNWGKDYFRNKNIENGDRELEWLLCHVLHCQRIDLFTRFEQPLLDEELSEVRDFVKRRVAGEPFQYIIGKAPFFRRDFVVTPAVLIPRPETETIIELAHRNGPFESVLDVGTGSACLAITLKLDNIAKNIIASDVSAEALTVAKENAENHKVEITFRRHDFMKTDIQSKFDLIVSNPPYISAADYKKLDGIVRQNEPEIALNDGQDGLSFYRRFAQLATQNLKAKGRMLLEFAGASQQKAIDDIFKNTGLNCQFHKDQNGEPRVVEVSH